MREGFVIGAAVIVAGLVLEWSIGPVAWEMFRWPVNGIVLVVFVAMIFAMHRLREKVYAFRFLSTLQAAVPAMCYAVGLTVVMGLTRQSDDARGLNNMPTFWPFVLIYVYVTLILGLVVWKHAKRSATCFSLLFHLGLFITMTTAALGHADMQRLKMMVILGEREWQAVDAQGNIQKMPFSIELKRFVMETYDDGSPKRFASEIEVLTQTKKSLQATVDVNKPVEVGGWRVYQYGYDPQKGAESRISIFELVRDPWLPYVYSGIYMMLAGGLLMFISGLRKKIGLRRKEEKA